MNHRLIQSYQAFTITPGPGAVRPGSVDVSAFLASLADSNHSILIRGLLDSDIGASGNNRTSPSNRDRSPGGLSASPGAYALVEDGLEALRDDALWKFREFRDKWRKRLGLVQLLPFLQRNQWIAPAEGGGFVLVGKGMRKEAKMLYLQSLHDMASDAERQVSFLGGRMFRLDGEAADLWHRETVTGNLSRVLPALEASLRSGEAEVFKKLRLMLGDLAQETFTERVGRWDRRVHATEDELFRNIAAPWYHPRYQSGFQGFMESFTDLAEALCGAMFDHYAGKWDLFLRGLAPVASQPTHSPGAPAVP